MSRLKNPRSQTTSVSNSALMAALEWLEQNGNYNQWCAAKTAVTQTMCKQVPELHHCHTINLIQRLRKVFAKHINLIIQHGTASCVPPESICGLGIRFDTVHRVAMSSRNSTPSKDPIPLNAITREQSPAEDAAWGGEFTNASASTVDSDDQLEGAPLLSQLSEAISPSTPALTSRNGTPLQAEAQLPKPASSAASRSATIPDDYTPSRNATIPDNSMPSQSGSATPPVRGSGLQDPLPSNNNNTPCQDTNLNTMLARILAQDREIRRQEVVTRQEHLRLEREHLQLEREQLNLIREQMQMQKILTDQLMQVLTKMVDKG